MALVMTDIKRVLAYSTISQLGYMMLALGVGAYGAAIFHLFTHAFFKALLFLGSGSVHHAVGTFDMRYMGGLRKVMPWTYVTFVIGALSIAGIFPLAGFWSKDEILADAWGHDGGVSQVVFWLGLAAVFMTAFYMFRVVFMTFGGQFRGGAESDPAEADGEGGVHLADSPAVMIVPLLVLAVAAVVAGFLVNPTADLGVIPIHWLSEFLSHGLVEVETPHFNFAVAAVSSALALSGIALAYVMYSARRESSERLGDALRPFHILLSRKYYFDELYEGYATRKAFYRWSAGFLDWADKAVVDGIARIVGYIGRSVGGVMAHAQTGQLQGYGVVISLGVLGILGVFFFLR
jgi:NADH-quinone oxidoreductase subunit L